MTKNFCYCSAPIQCRVDQKLDGQNVRLLVDKMTRKAPKIWSKRRLKKFMYAKYMIDKMFVDKSLKKFSSAKCMMGKMLVDKMYKKSFCCSQCRADQG